jgi:hypothetical protein
VTATPFRLSFLGIFCAAAFLAAGCGDPDCPSPPNADEVFGPDFEAAADGILRAHAFSLATAHGVEVGASWLPEDEFVRLYTLCSGTSASSTEWTAIRESEVGLTVQGGETHWVRTPGFAFRWDGESATFVDAVVEIYGPFSDAAAAVGESLGGDGEILVSILVAADEQPTLSVGSWSGPATLTPWVEDDP